MQSSASVIEAFGLKADTAAQQTKNMRMVTDGLTYVANATASSYADLSTGLNYVGQTAAAAHVSFMDTAIALGIMSNKGVEASTAGTALRQMFTT
ncbi:phage tail tape measure protein, partial [Klebsiella pneumoniae]